MKTVLPLHHLSVRVPWHDAGWNGCVCNDPRANASCMYLPRVQSKNIEQEEEDRGKSFAELPEDRLPPCAGEKATFLYAGNIVQKKSHPYAKSNSEYYGHFKETTQVMPAYSFMAIPFQWMLKDKETKASAKAEEWELDYDARKEPDLNFKDSWLQHLDNSRALLDAFGSALRPQKSLAFIYAKNIPLSESIDRVLIGACRVMEVGEIQEYDYRESASKDAFRACLWERPIKHSLRPDGDDGFLLPYRELIDYANANEIDGDTIAACVASASDRYAFSYGSELVSNDSAIDALNELRRALLASDSVLKTKSTKALEWIEEQIAALWHYRGAYPGIGAALGAFGVPFARTLQAHVERYVETTEGSLVKDDPWKIASLLLSGESIEGVDCDPLEPSLIDAWKVLPKEKRDYLKLLSRFALSKEVAYYYYQKDPFDAIKTHLLNPYTLMEDYYNAGVISFKTIDKAMNPPLEIAEAYPMTEAVALDGPRDKRRVRALIVDILEQETLNGHTLLPHDMLLEKIDARRLDPECAVTADMLFAMTDFFQGDERYPLEVITLEESTRFYKLHRLAAMRDVISPLVKKRLSAPKHKVDEDWADIIKNAIANDDESATIGDSEKEIRAQEEKAAALKTIMKARFSVLVGPAGTGKTTVLNALCAHEKIAMGGILRLAPTGKARIKLGAYALTVAQFLLRHDRYNVDSGYTYLNTNGKRYKEARTVIIDEASMLTEEQLAAIFDATESVDRYVLVGDPRQLPPIGTGRPFADIARYAKENAPDSYAELKVICRQGSSDGIDTALGAYFSGDDDAKDVFDDLYDGANNPASSVKLVQWERADEIEALVFKELAEELNFASDDDTIGFGKSLGQIPLGANAMYYDFKDAKTSMLEAWQILTPVHADRFGDKALNKSIQARYRRFWIEASARFPKSERKFVGALGTDGAVYGDKIINVKNTPWKFGVGKTLKYIANGEIGMISGNCKYYKDKKQEVQITFASQPDGSYFFYESAFGEDAKMSIALAYALTVHKAQGSGFGVVFLILPNPCFLLSRELLYTALTRHKTKLVVLHQGEFSTFRKYSLSGYSDTARRITDLFAIPAITKTANRYYDGNHIHITERGEFVISKSEVVIANILNTKKISYTYEEPFSGVDGRTIKPDFTIKDSDTGRVYYWEHRGMLGDREYAEKWEKKRAWYIANGVVPFDAAKNDDECVLVETRDNSDGGIDSKAISALADRILGR